MTTEKIRELIAQMTLEEKAGLCSGEDFWHTKAVQRLGIPGTMVSDGPHGLRKQDQEGDHLGVNDSIKAVCFPAGCASAASFDRELLEMMGQTLGEECQAEDVSVILGPAANIKRSPLCGRNFEYYSEDPYLASEIATGHIKGVQSRGVGTSLKHFLANNQETRRMSSNSNIDERTLREIYLAAFEGAVKNAKPWTVMCSYNRINGTYASENRRYLTEILRDEWGFDGYVMSDWGAVNERVEGIRAGLDLEMPSSGGINDAKIVEAVKNGSLSEADLDRSVERILNILFRYTENRDKKAVFDRAAHAEIAKKIAQECVILLKNEDALLPLSETQDIAFIGKFAEKPRYQGGGSSHINSFQVTSALKAVEGMDNIVYAQGYDVEEDVTDEKLLAQALEAAKNAKVAVIFAGLPDAFESEGYDREHMRMPDCQNRLISEVAKVQKNTVVVLHNGSPVEMPWIHEVKAVVEAYLGGQEIGSAVTDVIFGRVNPSGRLAETFPLRLEDNPSYLYYIGELDEVDYREGIFVGYRYYDKKNMEVLFPFGHGLSYTTFAYSNMALSTDRMYDTDVLTVSVDVTNTGERDGKEVVQLYVADKESTVIRPVKELKEFAKVELKAGETKTVTFELSKRAFAYYDTDLQDWYVESGEFDILIGHSSREIVCQKTVYVEATTVKFKKYHMNTLLGDIMKDPLAASCVDEVKGAWMMEANNASSDHAQDKAVSDQMLEMMIRDMPLRGVISFSNGKLTIERLRELVDEMNRAHGIV